MPRFSSRIRWDLQPNRIAEARAARRGNLLDLTQSNPTLAGFEYPQGLLNSLTDSCALRYHPAPAGLPQALTAIADYYDGTVQPGQVLLTASTSEAYSWLLKLLADPGDEILVPRPSYPLFEFLANIEGVNVRQYRMHYDHGWYLDQDALRTSITGRTRAIVFVHPNNPTGSCMKESEYQFITSLCASHKLALIADEVFLDYSFGAPVPSLSSRCDVLTFALSGLSKVCGLPQLKLGWIVVSGPDRSRTEAINRLEWIADTFLSVGTPVQHALTELLGWRSQIQGQIRQRTLHNLRFLRSNAARLLEPEAGWNATIQVPRTRTEEDWVLHLIEQHGVFVQPGYFYDFESEAYLILSLLTETEIFEEGARRTILATI